MLENENITTDIQNESGEAETQEPVVSQNDINLEEELNKAKVEIASLKDSWARERAEFQNYKRRTAGEFLVIKREAVKNFVIKILNPIDNLDRVSLGVNITDELKPFVDGVKMIRNEFKNILEKENIHQMNCDNEPFDATKMEAIAADESEDYSEEIVIEVYQPGYELKENNDSIVLRPARVRVGRPKL
ncbi:MAG: nucleotide exchange factor GrpE [Leptospiraceae bacterium]|nr:nucleotide exchange factor GrpE [Leptospiraceae bacterium]